MSAADVWVRRRFIFRSEKKIAKRPFSALNVFFRLRADRSRAKPNEGFP